MKIRRHYLMIVILAGLAIGGCATRRGADSQGEATPYPRLTIVPTPTIETPVVINPVDTRGCKRAAAEFQVDFIALEQGICFIYPSIFNLADSSTTDHVILSGPERQEGDGEIQATLILDFKPPSSLTLDDLVNQRTGAEEDVEFFETPIEVDGVPGIILEDQSLTPPTRELILVTPENVLNLSLTPNSEEYPLANMDADDAWAMVLSTMHFFPAESGDLPTEISGWRYQSLSDLGIDLQIPPDWAVNQDFSESYGLAPEGDENPHLVNLSTPTGLIARDVSALMGVLKPWLSEQGIAYSGLQETSLAGQPAVEVLGRPDLCKDVFFPGDEIVREISLDEALCDVDGKLLDDRIQAILDTLVFTAPVQ